MKKNRVVSNNFYFLRKAFKVSPIYIILSICMRIMAGMRTSFMYVFFLPYVISCVETGSSIYQILTFISISILTVSLSYAIQSVFDNIYMPISKEKMNKVLKNVIFEKACLTDLEMYDSEDYYTSFVLANSESSNRISAVIDNLLNLLEAITSVVSIIGYSLTLDMIVPIIASVSFFISMYMNRSLSSMRVEYDEDMKKINKEVAMLHRILYLPEYAKDIRLTNIRDLVLQLCVKINKQKENTIHRKGGKVGFVEAVKTILSLSLCIDFFVPLYLVYRILISRTLVVSGFIAILNGCAQLQLKLDKVSDEIGIFYQNGEFIERYRKIELRNCSIESCDRVDHIKTIQQFFRLDFINVGFRYSSCPFELNDINLTIQKGEKIAIVGPNGSGKTTLIKLLLRFYDCSCGEIRINNVPIKNININDYRRHFSTLFQDFNIYSISVANNISMDAQCNKEKVTDALKRANMEIALPDINQNMTRELYEDGVLFSSGQLQKIALSRIFYEDHDIYVMDEPTSAMDVVFERQFYDIIFNQLKDKTVLFVSHRLSPCTICDKIIYMENGRIKECGSHSELMSLRGGYAHMFDAQVNAFN